MSFGDTLGYLLVGNPISQAMISTMSGIAKSAGITPKKLPESSTVVVKQLAPLSLSELSGRHYHFVRLAGLCGATAIIMGGYGKRAFSQHNLDNAKDIESRMIFDGAYRFHFMHSFALLGVPLAHRPVMTGSLMTLGTILFCGPMYYRAFTSDKRFVQISTLGGFCLIAAWLSLLF